MPYSVTYMYIYSVLYSKRFAPVPIPVFVDYLLRSDSVHFLQQHFSPVAPTEELPHGSSFRGLSRPFLFLKITLTLPDFEGKVASSSSLSSLRRPDHFSTKLLSYVYSRGSSFGAGSNAPLSLIRADQSCLAPCDWVFTGRSCFWTPLRSDYPWVSVNCRFSRI